MRVKTTSLSNKTTSDFGLERERERLTAESEEFRRSLSFVVFRAQMSDNSKNVEMQNANASKEHEIDASSARVSEILGEPAIIINGVPDVCPSNDTSSPCNAITLAESDGEKGFGEWLEGREVQKLFGGQYYSGVVTQYDKEAGWYRVVYEDGDSEDLDWHELEEVLLPLDIMVPLKTLALKTIRRTKRSGQNVVRSHTRLAKNVARKGRTLVNEGESLVTPNNVNGLQESAQSLGWHTG
ncbi:hypothetical protein TIFTF001_008280 [Ficus carica]|uniref:PTM/DIR17-like Tudor domain-containing protein n=1 Tax=Ficus carica TaxID=3494 RepID=A0AA87ZMQ8_FICCA|nr:hypothetical protein TIFTF001_008280 [Ficus carica]